MCEACNSDRTQDCGCCNHAQPIILSTGKLGDDITNFNDLFDSACTVLGNYDFGEEIGEAIVMTPDGRFGRLAVTVVLEELDREEALNRSGLTEEELQEKIAAAGK